MELSEKKKKSLLVILGLGIFGFFGIFGSALGGDLISKIISSVTFFGFSIFIGSYVQTIYLPIISFILLTFLSLKRGNSLAFIFNLLLHLSFLLTIAMINTSVFYSSLLSFISILLLFSFLVVIPKDKEEDVSNEPNLDEYFDKYTK